MIQVVTTYDILPNVDLEAYVDLIRRGAEMIQHAPGAIEITGARNLAGSPRVRSTVTWASLEAWAAFITGSSFQEIQNDLRDHYITNVDTQIWDMSPVVPQPIAGLAT